MCPNAWPSLIDAPSGDGRGMEPIDGFVTRGGECDVKTLAGGLCVGAVLNDGERRLAFEAGGPIAHP